MGGEKEEVRSTGEEFKTPIVQGEEEERRRDREREGETDRRTDRQPRTRTEPPDGRELRGMDVTAAMDKVGAQRRHLRRLIAGEPEVRGQGLR